MENLLFIMGCNTLLSFMYTFIYKSTRIRKKHIKGINLLQIILTTIVSATYLLTYISIIYEISQNKFVRSIYFSDTLFLISFVILIAVAFTGLGIHFATKVIAYHLPSKGEIVRVNKFLHITLSHLLIYTSLILSLGILSLYEHIHPFAEELKDKEVMYILSLGLVAGGLYGLGFARGRSLSRFYSLLSVLVAVLVFHLTYPDYQSLPLSIFLFVTLLMIGITQIVYHVLHIKKKLHISDIPAYNTFFNQRGKA